MQIKSLALIENSLFDGDKIHYDQLLGGWIIPINISCFFDCYMDEHFDVRIYNDNSPNILNKRDIYFQIIKTGVCKKTINHDNRLCITNNNTFFCNFHHLFIDMFAIIWQDDNNKLLSYKLKKYDQTSGKYSDKIIYSIDFKKVKIHENEEAIIIPLCTPSFSALKYLIKNLQLVPENMNDLNFFKTSGSRVFFNYEKNIYNYSEFDENDCESNSVMTLTKYMNFIYMKLI